MQKKRKIHSRNLLGVELIFDKAMTLSNGSGGAGIIGAQRPEPNGIEIRVKILFLERK